MKKIIFVCTGNTCRSPMIEQILKHKLKLENMGIHCRKKKAKQLTKNMVDDNTLLVAITSNHKEYIHNVGKTISLSDLASGIDVLDPYGQDLVVYEKCAKIFDFITDEMVQLIKKGELI